MVRPSGCRRFELLELSSERLCLVQDDRGLAKLQGLVFLLRLLDRCLETTARFLLPFALLLSSRFYFGGRWLY